LGRTADYLFMLLFGATLILCMAPFLDMYFLGMGLTSMLVYVWSRRNPNVHMSILGILTFKSPYLPWVLLLFSLMLNQSIMVDIIGIATGHIYYFLEDVYPARTGTRLLRTPRLLTWLFQEAPPALDADGVPLPQVDAAPGGFAWGQGRPVGAEAQ
jgi:Derlin-2/3